MSDRSADVGASVSPAPTMSVVRLAAIREDPLSTAEVLHAVVDPAAGGIALFVGAVRNHDDARRVAGLAYSAHPTAADALAEVAGSVGTSHGALAVAVIHRVGDLEVGDLAVVAAVACAHRHEAFAACEELIDTLKQTVPIWKHQRFSDGTDEWVGTP